MLVNMSKENLSLPSPPHQYPHMGLTNWSPVAQMREALSPYSQETGSGQLSASLKRISAAVGQWSFP